MEVEQMFRSKTLGAVIAAAALALLANSAVASVIIAGVTATASSYITEGVNLNTAPINTVNDSGMTGDQCGIGTAVSWFSETAGAIATDQEWIQWDLGQACLLDSIHVWNENQKVNASHDTTVDGINQVDIYISSVAAPDDPEGAGSANWTLWAEDVNLPKASGLATYTGFDLETATSSNLPATPIRWVRFEVDSTHDTVGVLYDVGLSEIRFYEVPEPATMALVGLGGLAVLRRRRG